MTQFATHASSSQGSNYSNVTQYMPNTGMYMGQFPWPQPAYIPHPGYAPTHPYYPHGGVPRNGTHGTAPPHAPVAPSSGVGHGVARHAFQHAPVAPSSGVGPGVVRHAFQAGRNDYYPPATANVSHATRVGPYPPLTAAAPPPQHPSVPPITVSAPTNLSVSKKRAGEERVADERKVKRRKVCGTNADSGTSLEIEVAALVEPTLPPSQVRDITLAEASGDLEFWRWINHKEDPADPAPPLSNSPLPPLPETLLTEGAENTQDPDFWATNEIEEPALVESVLPSSQVREITLAEASGDVGFWRWINDKEDSADPAPPLVDSSLPPSQVRGITLADVGGDVDILRWINEIKDLAVTIPVPSFSSDLDFWKWVNDTEDADPALALSDSPVSPSPEIQVAEATEEDFYSEMSKHDMVMQEAVEDPDYWLFRPGREHPAFLYNVDPYAYDRLEYITASLSPSPPLMNHEM